MSTRSALVVAMFVAASVQSVSGEEQPPVHSITISGTAVSQVAPDIIVWSIRTLDESKDLPTAKASSDEKLHGILALVKELGVKPEDAQTGYLSITREYNQDERGRRVEFRCFSVRRGVTLKQRDLARFDEYLTKLVASAEMEVDFSFDSSRMTELRWETRLKAVEIARKKAEAMANVAGAKVGKAITIEEGGDRSPASGNFSNSTNVVYPMDGQPAQAADIAQGTFAPGSIEVKVTINAVFELN